MPPKKEDGVLKFKDAWRKAKTIKIFISALKKHHNVTREQLVNLAKEGKLSAVKMKTFFTPESLVAFNNSKTEA